LERRGKLQSIKIVIKFVEREGLSDQSFLYFVKNCRPQAGIGLKGFPIRSILLYIALPYAT
jgi:hypothetical protein